MDEQKISWDDNIVMSLFITSVIRKVTTVT